MILLLLFFRLCSFLGALLVQPDGQLRGRSIALSPHACTLYFLPSIIVEPMKPIQRHTLKDLFFCRLIWFMVFKKAFPLVQPWLPVSLSVGLRYDALREQNGYGEWVRSIYHCSPHGESVVCRHFFVWLNDNRFILMMKKDGRWKLYSFPILYFYGQQIFMIEYNGKLSRIDVNAFSWSGDIRIMKNYYWCGVSWFHRWFLSPSLFFTLFRCRLKFVQNKFAAALKFAGQTIALNTIFKYWEHQHRTYRVTRQCSRC